MQKEDGALPLVILAIAMTTKPGNLSILTSMHFIAQSLVLKRFFPPPDHTRMAERGTRNAEKGPRSEESFEGLDGAHRIIERPIQYAPTTEENE